MCRAVFRRRTIPACVAGVVAFLKFVELGASKFCVGTLLGPEGTAWLVVFLWAVITTPDRCGRVCGWWSAGGFVKCRVDASIFFLDLRPRMPILWSGVCGRCLFDDV